MAGLMTTRANVMLDTELTGSMTLRLYTVAPTATTNGTEVAGSGYGPQAITFGSSINGTKTQNADINFPACTGTSYIIVAWAIADASANLKVFRAFPSITVNPGDVVKFLVASNPVAISLS